VKDEVELTAAGKFNDYCSSDIEQGTACCGTGELIEE